MSELDLKSLIKSIRKSVKLNQSDFGKRINKSLDIISNWERGISIPSPLDLEQISIVYNIDLTSLLDTHKRQMDEPLRILEAVNSYMINPNVDTEELHLLFRSLLEIYQTALRTK